MGGPRNTRGPRISSRDQRPIAGKQCFDVVKTSAASPTGSGNPRSPLRMRWRHAAAPTALPQAVVCHLVHMRWCAGSVILTIVLASASSEAGSSDLVEQAKDALRTGDLDRALVL